MDAQNAAGPDKTKPAAAAASEPKRPDHEPGPSRSPASPPPAGPPVSDPRPSSPVPDKDAKPTATSSVESSDEKNADAANSDAETIVLPGKDGHSPSKVRKVKHEDKSEDEINIPSSARAPRDKEGRENEREREHSRHRDGSPVKDRGKDGIAREKEKDGFRGRPFTMDAEAPTDPALSQSTKKKRLNDKLSEKPSPSLPPPRQPAKDASASSPPPKRRKSIDANAPFHSDSNSDTAARHKSIKQLKDKPKGADKLIPHKRKASRPDSDDDDENRKARRQRTAPASTHPDSHPPKQSGEQQQKSGPKLHDHTRSVSPQSRTHRRSTSTHLPSSAMSQKKKRVPAPLQSTEYQSDESSASGSPYPRSSKLRNLATPGPSESTTSPAKMGPHKKHLDAHGQTFLARACARGEYDQAKQRLGERPEDLNVADYAGNTPLQIAAINGCEDIVELLINAGCNLECVNYDKDTPLLDAVDNGHLAVVKLLLGAGVNPRKANVHGEEPLDRVNDEFDNAEEIRTLLTNARQRMGERRRTSEEQHHDSHASQGPESPRRSPASNANAQGPSNRRAGTVRATKTSNHLLYMPMDDKTLRTAAGRGDEETVTRILQVRDGCDDSEAMVNAARGGHDVVMQLLLALGGANPDPPPVSHMSAEVATPMLAAIGQENIKVIQLLLDQGTFDPTRRFKGESYFEIARRRQGTNWKDEEHVLKKAYDEHRKSRSKDPSKTKSPIRREREKEKEDREHKRAGRAEGKDDAARSLKRSASSPSRSGEPKKRASSKSVTSPKEKRRSHDDSQTSPKRAHSRPKTDDRLPTINVSDRENSPAMHKTKVKRADSEMAAASSEGETVKPRRKLISKGELRGEKHKQRRASQVSTSAPSLKDPASPLEPRSDDHPEKEKDKPERDRPEKSDKPDKLEKPDKPKGEKYRDLAKALKRDPSKDRLSVSGESAKRHRTSATPPHSNNGDKDEGEAPAKKRRLDAEGKERRPKSSLGEDRPAKPTMSREHSLAKSMKAAKLSQKAAAREDDERREHKVKKLSDPHRRESGKSVSSDKSIHVKCEDADVDMRDAPPLAQRDEGPEKAKPRDEAAEKAKPRDDGAEKPKPRDEGAEKPKQREEAAEKAKQLQEEQEKKRAAEKAEANAKEEQEKKRAAEKAEATAKEEQKRRELEEKELEKKKREEEEAKRVEEAKRKEEEEKKRRKEEEEKKRREEEEKEKEKKRLEDEERKRKEEEERKKKEEEDERKRKAEEERKRKEEEERVWREEEERKQREEAEKKRKEEEERRLKEEEERKGREAEEKRKREEEERLHREQQEREAAEAAKRKREEDERREREHRERQRAAREAEIRRQREEQERARLAKLPALLRWLETCPNPKTAGYAERFKHMQGVRYDTIRPEATGTPDGREQWVLNTQVALLLGEKDLSLSRYTAWDRIPVSELAKISIWRLEADRYALTLPGTFDLGHQLPEYYGEGVDPHTMSSEVMLRLRTEAWDRFLQTDMFFVKVS